MSRRWQLYSPTGHTAYHHVGADPATNPLGLSNLELGLSVAGTAIGAYHGYKRNNSVGWAIGWAVLGGMFPVITSAVAFAQGISKRKGT
jgi:hypothetical protein